MTNWIKKLFQNQAIRYIFFGGCTTLVNLVSYAAFRHFLGIDITVANFLSISLSILFAYVVNKLIVFRNYNMSSSYLVKEAGAFVAARAFSGVVTWVLMVVMVKLGGDRGFIYELFCKFTSSVLNMVLNYVFSKLWIFKNKPE